MYPEGYKPRTTGIKMLLCAIVLLLVLMLVPVPKEWFDWICRAVLLLLVAGIPLGISDAVKNRRALKAARAAQSVVTPPAVSFSDEPLAAPGVPSAPVTSAPRKTVKSERVHVRGVDNYRGNILKLAHENPDYDLTKSELAESFLDERVWRYDFNVSAALVPEPDNEYDPNAIMVQANGLCVGYVPKGSTAHIRKLMDGGRIKSMDLDIGGGKYKEVCEDDDGKYEMDRGERPFSAVLELFLTEADDEQA